MSTPFKMKGFSGFGNSPIENNDLLDTKLKDVPKTIKKSVKKVSKKASDAISNVKESIGNTTIKDIIKSTPQYKIYKNVKNKFTKTPKKNDVSDAGKNAMRGLTEEGLEEKVGTKRGLKEMVTIKRRPQEKIKTIKKIALQKIPVDNTIRLVTTPKKYNVPRKKKA